MRRAFTVLELVVVIGVILILMALALTITSTVLSGNDRRSMQGTFLLLDQAIASWQAQTGRELTFGRIAVPAGTNGPPDFALGEAGPSAAFDIYEENFDGTYAICVVVDRLASNPDAAEILSKIPSSMFRSVPVRNQLPVAPSEALPTNWLNAAANIDPNQMPPAGTDWTLVREICDPWDKRIAVVFPGRAARPSELSATGTSVDREDGSVRTRDEVQFGICRGRKICFVSAGPDGEFRTDDDITSYELLPRPQP
jgi:type II secretory pathway pseudopilin PulG